MDLEFEFYIDPSSYRSYSVAQVEKWEQLGGFMWCWMLYKQTINLIFTHLRDPIFQKKIKIVENSNFCWKRKPIFELLSEGREIASK